MLKPIFKLSLLTNVLCAVFLFNMSAHGAVTSKKMHNEAAYIPAQCYTETKDEDTGKVYNPCYTCHTNSVSPNFVNDDDLQQEYDFPEYALKNRWTNLFTDKSEEISRVSDEEILQYIRQDNYKSEDGGIILAEKLKNPPAGWDYNNDGEWSGYVPDCRFNFDEEGFDRKPDGSLTWWRSYAYTPFPGAFWPANGSTDDVLIRLGEPFRKDKNGRFDKEVYKINLAVVEAVIKRKDVYTDTIDETKYNTDFDKDGKISRASKITYRWEPLKGVYMHYAGLAEKLRKEDRLHLAAGLFPEGTEFVHTVRYIDVTDGGGIALSARMKELRYAKKKIWRNYGELLSAAHHEVKETDDFPDRLTQYFGDSERGVSNSAGWVYQGFIEDKDGSLRPQTFEETVNCMGCHGGVGITDDGVYTMRRKLGGEHYQRGWYHWSQKSMKGLSEPKMEYDRAGVQYEYSLYLMYNKAGDEYRQNKEIIDRFFNEHGEVKQSMLEKLHDDITVLLYPSKERALRLNKAYRSIVRKQSFHLGKDVSVVPSENVHKEIKDTDTGIKDALNTHMPVYTLPVSGKTVKGADADYIKSIHGSGMQGPDGQLYGINKEGMIFKSTYGMDDKSIHFSFPSRLTLPTRFLVANGKNDACYTCHRLGAPVPADNPSVDVKPKHTSSVFSETADLKPLTSDSASDYSAAFSPDGSKIAWISDKSGSLQLWMMSPDGTNKTQLTKDGTLKGWPVWSSDSKEIVFWASNEKSGEHFVKIIPVNSSERRVKTLVRSDEPIARPAFSPDGKYIAYGASIDHNWDIWVITKDGKRKYRLTESVDMQTNPLWSSDGRYIAHKVAPSGAYGLTVEKFLNVKDGFENVSTIDWSGPHSVQMSAWSPDNSKIVYTSEVVSGTSGSDRVSYKVLMSEFNIQDGKTGKEAKIISEDKTLGDRGGVFSPDGSKIAFWAWDKNRRATLWTADADGGNLKQLTQNGRDTYPQWSPDGKKIVFESFREGRPDIWIMNIK